MARNNQAALLKVVRDMPYFTLRLRAPGAAPTNPTGWTTKHAAYRARRHRAQRFGHKSAPMARSLAACAPHHHNHRLCQRRRVTLANARVNSPFRAYRKIARAGIHPAADGGQIGVLGGLIQDRLDNQSDGLPGLGMLDGIGRLFRIQNRPAGAHRTGGVLRPTLVEHPAVAWRGSGRAGPAHCPMPGFQRERTMSHPSDWHLGVPGASLHPPAAPPSVRHRRPSQRHQRCQPTDQPPVAH